MSTKYPGNNLEKRSVFSRYRGMQRTIVSLLESEVFIIIIFHSILSNQQSAIYNLHLATETLLLPGHVFGTASQYTCATKTLLETVLGMTENVLVLMLLPGRNATSCIPHALI